MPIFTGKNVDQAVAGGLATLKLEKTQVEIKIINEGKSGFLFFGRQKAEVELIEKKIVKKPTSKKTIDEKKEIIASKPLTAEEKAARSQLNEKAVHDVGYYLADITELMGIDTEINVQFERRQVTYDFNTSKQGLLIGKHGKSLNALQYLAQVNMNQKAVSRMNVILDVGGYRQRREETIERLTIKVAKDVIRTGETIQLDPMPANERKQIHFYLARNNRIKTTSVGTGTKRSVIVAPKNKTN
ncbi:RNA-binding cell elongation regulator Jag/EloR [Dellaglioa sp. L3N]